MRLVIILTLGLTCLGCPSPSGYYPPPSYPVVPQPATVAVRVAPASPAQAVVVCTTCGVSPCRCPPPKAAACTLCGGSHWVTCGVSVIGPMKCNGTGWLRDPNCLGTGTAWTGETCPACKGTGILNPCPTCNGRGRVPCPGWEH